MYSTLSSRHRDVELAEHHSRRPQSQFRFLWRHVDVVGLPSTYPRRRISIIMIARLSFSLSFSSLSLLVLLLLDAFNSTNA